MNALLSWLAGFFEDSTAGGAPSSKRLTAILAHFVTFCVILLLAGFVAGMLWAARNNIQAQVPLIQMVLSAIVDLCVLVVTGGAATYLIGQGINKRGEKPSDGESA